MAGRPGRDHAISADDGGRLRARLFALSAGALSTALGLTLAACGLTADFSNLQGGVREGGVASDAASNGDAGAGEAAVSDGGFCATRAPAPKLCADFDEGRPLGEGWTLLDTSQGQTTRIDANAFSPPGAFLSGIAPIVDGTASARLQESLPVLSTQVHLEAELFLGAGDPGPFELIALHEQTSDGATHGLFYKEEQGKLLIYMDTVDADGGKTQAIYPLGAPPSGWRKVTIDIVLGDHGSVVVKHDDQVVVQALDVATSTQTRAQLFVEVGVYAFQRATANAYFDNVVVDWK